MGTPARDECRFGEVIDRVVPIFTSVDAELVLVACLDGNDCMTEGEFFGSYEQPKNTLPVEELFYLARRLRAAGILVATRAAGPIDKLYECDLDYAGRVKAAGNKLGVPVLGHFLIRDGRYRNVNDHEYGVSA